MNVFNENRRRFGAVTCAAAVILTALCASASPVAARGAHGHVGYRNHAAHHPHGLRHYAQQHFGQQRGAQHRFGRRVARFAPRGGAPTSLLEAVLACEANPTRLSVGAVAKSIWNRQGNPLWGGTLTRILTKSGQYVRNCGKGGGIYREAAVHIMTYGPDSYSPEAARMVGSSDSFHTGRGVGGNRFYNSGAGRHYAKAASRVKLRYAAYRPLLRSAPVAIQPAATGGFDFGHLFD